MSNPDQTPAAAAMSPSCCSTGSSSMLDADNRRAMIFPCVGEILEGRHVLNSSPEIETLLHTMALVLNINRGMLVRY